MNLSNKLTVLRMFMIPIFIIIVSVSMGRGTTSPGDTALTVTRLMGTIIFAIVSFTDWLNGKTARTQDSVASSGKFTGPLTSKALVMTTFIVLAGQGKVPAWIITIIVCRELAITGLWLLLVEHGEVMAAVWPGRVKTVIQMVIVILLLINNIPFSVLHLSLGQIMLYACLIFTIYSGADYFVKGKDIFKGSM